MRARIAADTREPVLEHAAGEERVSDLRDQGASWLVDAARRRRRVIAPVIDGVPVPTL